MFISIAIVSLFTCFLVSFFAKKFGLVDKPDGINKVHKGNIALGGGLCTAIPLFLIFFIYDYSLLLSNTQILIILSSLSILFLGLVDDFKPLPVSIRLIAQVLASWAVILLTDLYVRDFGNLFGLGNLYISQLGIPITIFMVVGVTNAFNMLDGMDGLVSLVTLTALLAIISISLINALPIDIYLLFSITLLIFLIFNLGLFNRKWKVFLGDGGSMWIGFLMAWILIDLSQGPDRLIQPATALWVILLPLVDALSTFLSRIRRGKGIFHGDRTHIHHILIDSGLKKPRILFIFLFFSSLACSIAILATIYKADDSIIFYGFLTSWLFYHLTLKFPYTKSK